MRITCNAKIYETATATKIAEWNKEELHKEHLFQTTNNEFFLRKNGDDLDLLSHCETCWWLVNNKNKSAFVLNVTEEALKEIVKKCLKTSYFDDPDKRRISAEFDL